MNVGLGVFKAADNKNYVSLAIVDGACNLQITITGEDNYEHDIDELIRGLKGIKGDMQRAISGLEVVKEVPNGFRSNAAQRRIEHGSRS